MNLKNIKLNKNDFELLKFLARFKLMCATDAIFFYNSTYYQKRLQQLKNANYISRYYRIYIKLTPACIRFLESKEIRCAVQCRNKKYIERVIFVSKLGIELIKTRISFNLSWEMKGNNYTDWSRRFLGELEFRDEKYLIYYAKLNKKYIRQLQFDINKDLSYQNIIVFTEDLNIIDNKNQFIFPNKVSCILIHKAKIKTLGIFNKIDIKDCIERTYNKMTTDSDISFADYKVGDVNIIFMPYIDTHRIVAINNFYSLQLINSKLEILSFEENFDIIKKLLINQAKLKCSLKRIEVEND